MSRKKLEISCSNRVTKEVVALTVNSSFGIGGGGCFAGCESGVPIMLFIEGG